MSERRTAERVRVNLDARWEGVTMRCEGTVVDISASGCFMLTTDAVEKGEMVSIEIQLPTGRWIYLWAEVVYSVPEMGFAVRFTGAMDQNEEKMLAMLIDYVSEQPLGVGA